MNWFRFLAKYNNYYKCNWSSCCVLLCCQCYNYDMNSNTSYDVVSIMSIAVCTFIWTYKCSHDSFFSTLSNHIYISLKIFRFLFFCFISKWKIFFYFFLLLQVYTGFIGMKKMKIEIFMLFIMFTEWNHD